MFITLMQYSQFVKPAFDDFILPTKKYADIIIPRGGDNHIAVDLIVQHIRTKLGQHDLCKIYPNLYVIQSTFQVSLPKNCHSSSKFCFCMFSCFFFWITIHCFWSRADTGYAYPHTWFSNNKAWFCFLFWPINSFGAYLVLWAKRLIWYWIFEVSNRMGPLFICLIAHQDSWILTRLLNMAWDTCLLLKSRLSLQLVRWCSFGHLNISSFPYLILVYLENRLAFLLPWNILLTSLVKVVTWYYTGICNNSDVSIFYYCTAWLFVVNWSAKFERLIFFYHLFLGLFAGSVYTGVDFCKRLCGVSVIRRYKSIPINAFGFPLKKRLFYYYCSLLGFLYKWTNGLWDAFLVYKQMIIINT